MSRSVTLRPASKKASPVMAARMVANLVMYSMRPQMHWRQQDSSDQIRFSPFCLFSCALQDMEHSEPGNRACSAKARPQFSSKGALHLQVECAWRARKRREIIWMHVQPAKGSCSNLAARVGRGGTEVPQLG